ncbi:hypothetical protein A2U01_0006718, partial [Trifolium medium]|nr:hypothetical protein [Trifolium medium]
MGERWKQFKTLLSNVYVFGKGDKNGNATPFETYKFITKEEWDLFVQSRQTEEFQTKRLKGKTNASKNVHPHLLSRGGYEKLKADIMEENWKKIIKEGTIVLEGRNDILTAALGTNERPGRHEQSESMSSSCSKIMATRDLSKKIEAPEDFIKKINDLKETSFSLTLDHDIAGLSVYIDKRDLNELSSSIEWLSTSIVSLWCT